MRTKATCVIDNPDLPGTADQRGLAETMLRAIMFPIRSVIFASSVPRGVWEEYGGLMPPVGFDGFGGIINLGGLRVATWHDPYAGWAFSLLYPGRDRLESDRRCLPGEDVQDWRRDAEFRGLFAYRAARATRAYDLYWAARTSPASA